MDQSFILTELLPPNDDMTSAELDKGIRLRNNLIQGIFMGYEIPLEAQIAMLEQFSIPFRIIYVTEEYVDDKTTRCTSRRYAMVDMKEELADRLTGKLKNSKPTPVFNLLKVIDKKDNTDTTKEDNDD